MYPYESPLRIGAEDELAAYPVIEGLDREPGVEFFFSSAESLAQRVQEGTLDCALIPPLMAFRIPRCRLVPGLGVCATSSMPGEVLVVDKDIVKVQTVGAEASGIRVLDMARLTVALKTGRLPGRAPEGTPCDARAYSGVGGGLQAAGAPHACDVSAWWHGHTGLPWVWMVWACRFRAPYPRLRQVLSRSFDRGREAMAKIEAEAPGRFGLSAALAGSYLAGLYFRVASAEADSLRELARLARDHGLLTEPVSVEFC